jgi:hypothetical protein
LYHHSDQQHQVRFLFKLIFQLNLLAVLDVEIKLVYWAKSKYTEKLEHGQWFRNCKNSLAATYSTAAQCNDVYTAVITAASSAADAAVVTDTADEAGDVRRG